MKLSAGLDIDHADTFGELRFWGLRKEAQVYDEENQATDAVKSRTYCLLSTIQEDIIHVILPGDVPLREFPQNAVVEIVNPEIGSGARERFGGADAFWWTKADDIVAKKGASPPPPQAPPQGNKQTGDATGKA